MNPYESQRSRSFIELGPRSLRLNISNFFSLEIARPFEAKFHVEPPWDWGRKIYTNSPSHLTNMAAKPINGKHLKNLLLWNQKADYLEN